MATPTIPGFYSGAQKGPTTPSRWARYARPGPYTTKLSPEEENQFRNWTTVNRVPWQDTPNSDYDMRGYWRAQQAGDPYAKTSINAVDQRPHYPDTYKTPYHKTFSNESQYALPTAGRWQGNTFINPDEPEAPDFPMPQPKTRMGQIFRNR